MSNTKQNGINDAKPEDWDHAFSKDDVILTSKDLKSKDLKSKDFDPIEHQRMRNAILREHDMQIRDAEKREYEAMLSFKPAMIEKKGIAAAEILEQGSYEMSERARTYDTEGGERSMGKTVEMFNAMTGLNLTEEQGWKFMICLKLVRSEQGAYRDDSYVDGAAYFALAGETASVDRG